MWTTQRGAKTPAATAATHGNKHARFGEVIQPRPPIITLAQRPTEALLDKNRKKASIQQLELIAIEQHSTHISYFD
jgi:hypothetical protein